MCVHITRDNWRTINGAYSGQINITVEKVGGNKIFGVAEVTGT